MANQISKELYDGFMKVVASGDEAAARKFLTDHFKEFPEETQDIITMAFVEEALLKKNQDDQAVEGFVKQGLAASRVLQQAIDEVEKQAKLAEIKESVKS